MPKIYTPNIELFEELKNTIACPKCGNEKSIVKIGKRHTKSKGFVQRYRCKACNRQFTVTPLKGSQYQPKIIAFALSYYNIGHTLEETQRALKRTHKTNVPLPTIYDWTTRHEALCTFIPMRKKYELDWRNTLKEKKLHHQQIYHFKFHHLKINMAAKSYRNLRTYLWEVYEKDKSKIFTDSTLRCSSLKIDNLPEYKPYVSKNNNATRMTQLALTLAKNRATRHEAVEEFFLRNDSKTVAIEVPVYLYPKETNFIQLKETLTGHIDMLQFRNNKIYIMDYKPEKPHKAINQLHLYRIALSKRANIPYNKIRLAAFNENSYVEFDDKK